MIGQLQTAIQPALRDVVLEWEYSPQVAGRTGLMGSIGRALGSLLKKPRAAPDTCFQTPAAVPHVLTGTRFLVLGLAPDRQHAPTAVMVRASTPVGVLAVRVPAQGDVVKGTVLHCLAARSRIRDLEAANHACVGVHFALRDCCSAVRDEIVRLGIQYQLTSTHTSFVAVQPPDAPTVIAVHLLAEPQVPAEEEIDIPGVCGMCILLEH